MFPPINFQSQKMLKTSTGTVTFTTLEKDQKKLGFLPVAFTTKDLSASFSIEFGRPQTSLKSQRGTLILTTEGFRYKTEKRYSPYKGRAMQNLAEAIVTDKVLMASFLKLRSGLLGSVFEIAKTTGELPQETFFKNLTSSLKHQIENIMTIGQPQAPRTPSRRNPLPIQPARPLPISVPQAIPLSLPAVPPIPPQPRRNCTLQAVYSTIEETTRYWVEDIYSAWEQYCDCLDDCHDDWLCKGGCTVQAFVDIVTGHWEYISTICEVIVDWVWDCPTNPPTDVVPPLGIPGLFEGPKLSPSEILEKLITPLLKGTWRITKLRHLGISQPPFISGIPIALAICMDAALKKTFEESLDALLFGQIIVTLAEAGGVAGIESLLNNGSINLLAGAVTAALGITLAELATILFALLVLIGYHLLAIKGQIELYDLTNATSNGICLNSPSFIIMAASTLAFPISGLVYTWLTLNVPLIVTPNN